MQLLFGLICGGAVLFSLGGLMTQVMTLSSDAIILMALGAGFATVYLITQNQRG